MACIKFFQPSFVLLPLFLLVLSGCGKVSESGNKVRIPLDDGTGQYRLQTVEFKHLIDLPKMKNKAATLKIGGVIESSDQGVFLDLGREPAAKFIKSGDTLIPRDYDSLLMTTILYNFDLFYSYAKAAGLDGRLPFPMDAGAQVKGLDQNGDTYSDNAAYIPETKSFIFWNFTLSDALPIAINTGIVGHEFFHSIFDAYAPNIKNYEKELDAEMEKIWRGHFARSNDSVSFSKMCRNINTNNVISKMPEVVKIANIYLVRALNEGMADFFGYLHTRNPKWILPTAPQEYMRNLNFPSTLECTDKESQDWLSDLGAKIHLAVKTKNSKLVSIPDIHHYGASWAHFMYLTHQSLGSAINEITALRASVQFLEKLDAVVDKENGRNVITFGYLADLYLNTLATSKDIQVAALDGRGERKGQVCTAAKQAFPQSEYLQKGYCGVAK